MLKQIIKRDGTVELYTPSKLNKWAMWATDSLGDRVDWSGVVLDALSNCKETEKSQNLQKELINACLYKKDWPHNVMAGKLYAAWLHKNTFGDKMPTVMQMQFNLIEIGLCIDMGYTVGEYAEIEKIIDHTRDFNYAHSQIKQIYSKYSISNLITGTRYETPQYTYMRMAMRLADDVKDSVEKLALVKDYYDELSFSRLNAPTPNYVNLGTPLNGFASCCLYTVADTNESIDAGDLIASKMTAASAGIGTHHNLRSIGEPVRGGRFPHGGKRPYFATTAKSVIKGVQAGRAGAATLYFDIFEKEAKDLIMLQNPRTPEAKRNRDVHFAVMTNSFFAKKARDGDKIFSFNCFTAPDLHDALFSGDIKNFEALYDKYEKDDSFKKEYVDARELCLTMLTQFEEVSTLYHLNIEEANRHTPFQERINSSNLCVAPETPILTKEFGYVRISDKVGQQVSVWNGDQWSLVTVCKTGENQHLQTVFTTHGTVLEATDYHRWYVQLQNEHGAKTEVVVKRTHELQPGDKLIKFQTAQVDHGVSELPLAYENGFYTGDGTLSVNTPVIYLYGKKRDLLPYFENKEGVVSISDNNSRFNICYKPEALQEKFYIPSCDFTVQSRLEWLAGLVDSDGCLTNNNGTVSIQITSTNFDFLYKLKLMLQELGVMGSVNNCMDAGFRYMPDHKGGSNMYYCERTWRLLLANGEVCKLVNLGLQTRRIDLSIARPGNRDARQFEMVQFVLDKGRYDDTYCFTEPLKGMGVFSGVLTGNCLEILEPTSAYLGIKDLYKTEDYGSISLKLKDSTINKLMYNTKVVSKDRGITFAGSLKKDEEFSIRCNGVTEDYTVDSVDSLETPGEVALCSLAAIVLPNIHSDEQCAKTSKLALRMIDRCIHLSTYQLPHIGFTAKQRLNAAVGHIGMATLLARKGLKYSSLEGRNEIHRISERHAFFLIKAALELGQEKGNAPWIHKTKWPNGWLPIDSYKKTVDELVTVGLVYDWEWLRAAIIANGGIRFSCLIALMPTESSSKAAGMPNGPYPLRALSLKKSDENSVLDWVATDSDLLANDYEIGYDAEPVEIIKSYAVMQKFTDHSISADTYKDRSENVMLSDKAILTEYLTMVKYGVKSKYYSNTLTNAKDSSGKKKEAVVEENCGDSCKL